MPNCVADDCRKQIDPGWAFCPYCGADNRAPEERVPIAPHAHEYVGQEPYCVLCGGVEGVAGGSLQQQKVLASVALGVGLLLFAVFLDLIFVGATGNGLFVPQVQKLGRSPLGGFVCWGSFFVSMLACGYAYQVFDPRREKRRWKQLRDRRSFWNYQDDQPWWRRRRW